MIGASVSSPSGVAGPSVGGSSSYTSARAASQSADDMSGAASLTPVDLAGDDPPTLSRNRGLRGLDPRAHLYPLITIPLHPLCPLQLTNENNEGGLNVAGDLNDGGGLNNGSDLMVGRDLNVAANEPGGKMKNPHKIK